MSNPIGKVDITRFTSDDGEILMGELTVNNDNSLEGFLFENETLRRIIQDNPGNVSFCLVLRPAQPASQPEHKEDDVERFLHHHHTP